MQVITGFLGHLEIRLPLVVDGRRRKWLASAIAEQEGAKRLSLHSLLVLGFILASSDNDGKAKYA
jgi:hypothetical protein